jgi:hypothetical protein
MFKTWMDANRKWHRVDNRGNYFINGKCQNPKSDSNKAIGSNIPVA